MNSRLYANGTSANNHNLISNTFFMTIYICCKNNIVIIHAINRRFFELCTNRYNYGIILTTNHFRRNSFIQFDSNIFIFINLTDCPFHISVNIFFEIYIFRII